MTEDDLKHYVATMSTNGALEIVRYVEHLKTALNGKDNTNARIKAIALERKQRLEAIAEIVTDADASQTLQPEITQEQIGKIYRLAMGLYTCTEHIIEG